MDITPFKAYIKEKTGLTVDNASSESLIKEIQNIMDEKGLASPVLYLDLLRRTPDEFFRLLNFITINETYFFREPAYIRLLADRIIPELLKTAGGRKLKILSAGCSTGEEPYTLAMTLMEKYGTSLSQKFIIIGTDIDTDVLAKARSGIYGSPSFRNLDIAIKNRYFSPIGGNRYKIQDGVRKIVSFDILNLLSEPYPEFLSGLDVIFYRNVAIYFDKKTQKKVFTNLSSRLNENGYLIVSATETLSHDIRILPLIEMDGLFLFHKPAVKTSPSETRPISPRTPGLRDPLKPVPPLSSPLPKPFPAALKPSAFQKFIDQRCEKRPGFSPPQPSPARQSPLPAARQADPEELFNKALDLAQKKEYERALTILEGMLSKNPAFSQTRILKAVILINLKEMEKARNLCLDVIQTDPLCAEGYLVLGLIAKSEDNPDEALKRFKETLYLSPSNWLARFYQAELWQSKGENNRAMREFQNVINLLDKGHFNDHGLTYFPLSFSREDITRVCRHHMERLA
jgi:chemotaxis protein methyltransferase CheR